MIRPAPTRVFLALCAVHFSRGRATVREVAEQAGIAVSTCHHHLIALDEAGIVAYPQGMQGAVRPLLRVVERVA